MIPRGESGKCSRTRRSIRRSPIVAGAEGVDPDRDRLDDADRVGELHLDALGDPGRHQVLGHVPGHVAGRAVDLRRILPREGAAAVPAVAAVGVDDDLAAGQAAVPLRAADRRSGRSD